MADNITNVRIQLKNDTEAHWIQATNFKPRKGEIIIYNVDETHSSPRIKIGDGTTLVNSLPFLQTDAANTYLELIGGLMRGHIYLTGSNATTSTSNTSQLVFGAPQNEHISISAINKALVLNPNTTSTSDNITNSESITLSLNSPSQFPKGIQGNLTGNVVGNAETATAFQSPQSITLTGDVTGSDNSTGGWNIVTTIGEGKILNAMLAGGITKDKITDRTIGIAGNNVELGDSLSANNLRTSLGLANAMHFIGKATATVTDGGTEDPVISGYNFNNGNNAVAGDVVIDQSSGREYVWTLQGYWELLGQDASTILDSNDITASTSNTNTWISRITQNSDRSIIAERESLNTSGIWSGTAINATKIEQNARTNTYTNYEKWHTLLWGASNSETEGFTPTTITDVINTIQTLSIQPSTGTIRATNFKAIGGDFIIDDRRRGLYLKDSAGTKYVGIYDNGALWIGANSTNGIHHKGNTYISTGYNTDGTSGNLAAYLVIPKIENNSINADSYPIAYMKRAGTSTIPVYVDSNGALQPIESYEGSARILANYFSTRQTNANITHVNNGGVIHFKAFGAMVGKPMADGNILHFYWDNENAEDAQLFIPKNSADKVQWRAVSTEGNWNDWYTVIDNRGGAITNSTASGDPETGALTVVGGVGIKGRLNLGDTLTLYKETGTYENAAAQIIFNVKDTDTLLTASSAFIKVYNNHSDESVNSHMVIESGGNMFIGSGQSASAAYSTVGSFSLTKNMFISSENVVYIYANAQPGNSINNRIGLVINTNGYIAPSKSNLDNDNQQDLGTSANRWRNLYLGTSLYANGDLYTTTGSLKMQYNNIWYNIINNSNNGNIGINAASGTLFIGYTDAYTNSVDIKSGKIIIDDRIKIHTEENIRTEVNRNGIHIYGKTYGNVASQLLSNNLGILSYNDGGPQVTFGTTNDPSDSTRHGALIFTDKDDAAIGASWHFVSDQTDWNVISKRFHARTSISIGTDLPNISKNLYVSGSSQLNGPVEIKPNSYMNFEVSENVPRQSKNIAGFEPTAYRQWIILLLPYPTAINQSIQNFISGHIICKKNNESIIDECNITANICNNEIRYNLSQIGSQNNLTFTPISCTYNGYKYFALLCYEHDTPWQNTYFDGYCSSVSNDLPYMVNYKGNGSELGKQTIVNTEVANSISTVLTDGVITTVIRDYPYMNIKGTASSFDTVGGTTTFWRGDNSWSNIITGNLNIGGSDTAISADVTSGMASYLQIIAGSGGDSNYSGIGFHNPSISSASFGYQNFSIRQGIFRLRSTDALWTVTTGSMGLPDSWRPGNFLIGADGTDKVGIGYLISETNGATIGGRAPGGNTWAPLNIIGTQINFRGSDESQTIQAKFDSTGCLSLYPTGNSHNQGIRIHSTTDGYSLITLAALDNTGDVGSSANSWVIFNYNGNFGLTRNSALNASTYLKCTNNVWSWNGTADGNISGSAHKIDNLTTSDLATDTTTWRRVWFSYDNNEEGRPAYKDTIAFQTSTNTLKSGKYLVDNAVLLEYNSTDQSLDFIFG